MAPKLAVLAATAVLHPGPNPPSPSPLILQVRACLIAAGNQGVPQGRWRCFMWAAAPGQQLPAIPKPSHNCVDFQVRSCVPSAARSHPLGLLFLSSPLCVSSWVAGHFRPYSLRGTACPSFRPCLSLARPCARPGKRASHIPSSQRHAWQPRPAIAELHAAPLPPNSAPRPAPAHRRSSPCLPSASRLALWAPGRPCRATRR